MNLFTADLHLGHKNCILFDHRPFSDVDEMDEFIISMWNGRVYDGDDVWVLGDFTYRSKKSPASYLARLKGRKHLIIGNHDYRMLKDKEAMGMWESVDHIKKLHDPKYGDIILCHYPIADWEGMYHGSWHLFGHIHKSKSPCSEYMDRQDRAINAGCMLYSYAPMSMRELIEKKQEALGIPPELRDSYE